MGTITYGSFRVDFLHDKEKKRMKEDSLFLNIYDFWSLHRSSFMRSEFSFEPKLARLELNIIKKWKKTNELSIVNVFIRKVKKGDSIFNPEKYLNGGNGTLFPGFAVVEIGIREELFREISVFKPRTN